jgi:hypothetical protein
MFKRGSNLSHAQIRAKLHGLTESRERPASPNTEVPRYDPRNPAVLPATDVRYGPAWHSGMRAWGGVRHGPGKQDTPDIGRGKVITR